MIRWRNLTRLLKIQRVLVKHGLDEVVQNTHLYRPLSVIRHLWPGYWRKHDAPVGERLRLALIELGPIFVKFGQAISTRRDLLPRDIADELAKLQDRVPPFPGKKARQLAEAAYKQPLEEVFESFDEEPLAAASIAQVHAARLKDGTDVVVKILRPRMRPIIERDLEVLYVLARLAQKYWSEARRLRPIEVISEYEKTVLDELDMMREAGNAARLKRNFEGSPLLYVPQVYFDLSRPNVLVMERIRGIPISDIDALRAAGTDMKVLAENGAEIFFTQVFRHNFFHADMHPGNIFVDITDPEKPRYMAVDFGIVGTLSPRDQHYLAENFIAFFNRDYHRVARLHVDSGWVPKGTRIDEFEAAIRTVCEPIFNKPLKDISFGRFLLHLFRTARRFNMAIQPQLVLLQKTLLAVEGLGRQLYPDLDLWKTSKPVLESWMSDRASGREALKRVKERLPELSVQLQELLQLTPGLLQKILDGDLSVRVNVPEMKDIQNDLSRRRVERYAAISGGAVLVGGVLWLGLSVEPAWPGWLAIASSLVGLLLYRPR